MAVRKEFIAALLLTLFLGVFLAALPTRNKAPTTDGFPAASFAAGLPAFIHKESVLCPETATLGAFMDGHLAGGEAEGHRRVADLFRQPRDGCTRTLSRDRVQVLNYQPNSYTKVRWEGLVMMAEPWHLEN